MPATDLIEGSRAPPGCFKSSGHLVFDVKINFTLRARRVKDGHLSPDPIYSNFSGVVSRESIKIIFTHATLNDHDLYAADIKSAYPKMPTSEKDYIIYEEGFPLDM